MNLLGSIKWWLIACLAIVFFACEEQTTGLNLETDNRVVVKRQDFTFSTTNLLIDSTRTDHESLIALGRYEHPDLGVITTRGQFEYRFQSGVGIGDTIRQDSVIMWLELFDYTTLPADSMLTFTVHPSDTRLFSTAVYLGNKSLPLSIRPDTIRVKARAKGRPVRIPLQRLINEFYAPLILNQPANYQSIRGTLILAPANDAAQSAVFRLNADSSFIQLFSSRDTVVFRHRFTVNGTPRFTTVQRDRTGTAIESLPNLSTVDFNSNVTYVNPLAGLTTLVDIQPFVDFIQAQENIIINKAEIEIPTNNGTRSPTQFIRIYYHKPENGIFGEGIFTDVFGTLLLSNEGYLTRNRAILNSRLVDGTKYYSDITMFTDFFYNQLKNNNRILANKLVLVSAGTVTFTEAVIPQNEVIMRLYFTELRN